MGMYTEAVLRFAIKNDTPQEKALRLRISLSPTQPLTPFKDTAMDELWGLWCDSYYFDGETTCAISKQESFTNTSRVTLAFNLKNYEHEIQKLLLWLLPEIKTEGFIGFMRYEENENPTLIYIKDGQIDLKQIGE